jgi:hypothetical protein
MTSLKLLETTIVEFTLAGMDAIIDKGDEKIDEQLPLPLKNNRRRQEKSLVI